MTDRIKNWPRLSRFLDKVENAKVHELFDEPEEAAKAFFIGGIIIAVLGYAIVYRPDWELFNLFNALKDFYANFAAEAISIGVTVLIIERLTKRRAIQERKDELILQMGSPHNVITDEAVRQLRKKKWLLDGALNGCNLEYANLECLNLKNAQLLGANLSDSYLQYTDWTRANLGKAKFRSAELINAVFTYTILIDADMSYADLRFADLEHAFLIGTKLKRTKYNSKTKWPEDFDPIAAGAMLVED